MGRHLSQNRKLILISYAPSVVKESINRLLMEKAELRPDEVWYVGDQYECDIKGSLNAGPLPIWYIGAIDLPYTKDENILTVKTWSEIERYMDRRFVAGAD